MVSTAGELNDVGRVVGAGHIRMVAKQPQHCQASVPHTEQEEGSNPSLTHHHTQHISLPPVSPSVLALGPWDAHFLQHLSQKLKSFCLIGIFQRCLPGQKVTCALASLASHG